MTGGRVGYFAAAVERFGNGGAWAGRVRRVPRLLDENYCGEDAENIYLNDWTTLHADLTPTT